MQQPQQDFSNAFKIDLALCNDKINCVADEHRPQQRQADGNDGTQQRAEQIGAVRLCK